MRLLTNIGVLYRCLPEGGQGAVHPIPRAALAWDDDRIEWVGAMADLPAALVGAEELDADGGMVIPGLIDCHTHLAFGGWRANEFEQKIRGRGYLEIARAGGGILSTVSQTRSASDETLATRCRTFLSEMLALGVTTVEVKSGYGLGLGAEIRLLELYRMLAGDGRQRLVPTLLAAHAVPGEYQGNRDGYLALILEEIIPAVGSRGLASFCDVFVEDTAFTVDEARRILERGVQHGLVPKLHADQLTDSGGAALAAAVGAASADHLERISDQGIAAMADANVVAVSLPIATLYLRQDPLPARRLIDAGVAVAVATDFNPGSAPSYHLPLAMTLACLLQRMTPKEVLKGATSIAARAVRRDDVGSLAVGQRADLALVDADSVEQWLYHFRANATRAVWLRGQRVPSGSII